MKQLIKSLFAPSEPLWENKEVARPSYSMPASRTQKQNAIVQEIHDTFYSEVDRLLAEAGIKLSSATDKADLLAKSDRLARLGFGNTKEVSVATEERVRLNMIEKINTEKENLIEAINYFSLKYPQYKFITEASVKKICQKYGLIYGEVSLYKGEVPDKNLAEIEKFSVKEEDFVFEQQEDFRNSFTFMGRQEYRRSKSRIGYKQRSEYEKAFNEISQISPDDIRYDYRNHFDNLRSYRRRMGNPAPLEIAAPIKDFDTRGMEVKDFKLSKIEVPDPVVLHPVMFKGIKHYLIVTAWGLEATDELVVNQRNN